MHERSRNTAAGRRGFTLTELLVVIAIIAILVALVSVGVMTAMAKAKATRIKVELDQIDSAMKNFKDKYGAYPPCDLRVGDATARARLRQFVAMAFPRYDLTNLQNDIKLALAPSGDPDPIFRPDQALVFWLRGFSSDPAHPFVTPSNQQISGGVATTVKVTLTPLFGFDTARLAAVKNDGTDVSLTNYLPSYFPSGSPVGTTGAPYVYWDYRSYPFDPDKAATGYAQPARYFNSSDPTKGDLVLYTTAGVLVPYWNNTNGNTIAELPPTEDWANPDSFQLMAAGIDRKYGTTTTTGANEQRLYPTGQHYDNSSALADDDNAANFTSAARIGDDKP